MKKKSINQKIRQKRLLKNTYQIFDAFHKEKHFFSLIIFLSAICICITPYTRFCMWFGFILASYSAIANDSIQTLGTFIASNSSKKWWHLWLFIGIIFVLTISYSWVMYDGDVTYQRLSAKGFAESPSQFHFLQLFSPIVLLVLTRFRIPVSTTFLLLNIFVSDMYTMRHVIQKSLLGYFVSFVVAFCIWYFLSRIIKRIFKASSHKKWIIFQWITSGLLWSIWLMQDASNIAVFLPRKLNIIELFFFISIIFLGIGLLFYAKGDRLQHMVKEKSEITDVRAATLVDLVYIIILFYFKYLNNIPISTTWVFIGLLGGRELGISINKKRLLKRRRAIYKSFRTIKKDLHYALLGLIISIFLAVLSNSHIQHFFMSFFKLF